MEVITYKLNEDYSIDLNYLQDNIKEDDLIIFNSPANPT
jgi:histidinol-phosphate/aromatic aminotransferase/cobyric acid decarboxylase-like protein